jgi:hypothetical protein
VHNIGVKFKKKAGRKNKCKVVPEIAEKVAELISEAKGTGAVQ